MYTQAYGLEAEPFAPTPDPAFLYLSPQHRDALAALEYGLRERRGFVTLVGEVGTGKTTVLYTLMENLGDAIDSAFLAHTTLEYNDLLRAALIDLGVSEPGATKGELVATLNRFLHDQSDNGRITALVIDEAQNLSASTLEELRLLTDYETFQHKLLQIVLVGQPELDQRLADPQVRQLRDRIAVRARLVPLRPGEVHRYIDHRLRVVGSTATKLFTKGAVAAIGRWTEGNPRRINTLCHNALLAAYGRGERQVGRALVRTAIAELEARDPRSAWAVGRQRLARAVRDYWRTAGAVPPSPSVRSAKGRRVGLLLAALIVLLVATVLRFANNDPAALEVEVAEAGQEKSPAIAGVSGFWEGAQRALDTMIPKDEYLEWRRRARGFKD